eukprot:EG_transcript_16130
MDPERVKATLAPAQQVPSFWDGKRVGGNTQHKREAGRCTPNGLAGRKAVVRCTEAAGECFSFLASSLVQKPPYKQRRGRVEPRGMLRRTVETQRVLPSKAAREETNGVGWRELRLAFWMRSSAGGPLSGEVSGGSIGGRGEAQHHRHGLRGMTTPHVTYPA